MKLEIRRSPTCAEVRAVVQAVLDGEAPRRVVRRVTAHLDVCADCTAHAADIEEVKARIGRLRRGLDPQVLARLTAHLDALDDRH